MNKKFQKFKFDISWKLYNLGVNILIYMAMPFVWFKVYRDRRKEKDDV